MVIPSIEVKKKNRKICYDLVFKKRHMNKNKTLHQWILENILQNQTFQRTAKFIEMKSSVILVKVDEMYNILKTLLATGNWSRDEGGIRLSKFFAGAFTTPLLY